MQIIFPTWLSWVLNRKNFCRRMIRLLCLPQCQAHSLNIIKLILALQIIFWLTWWLNHFWRTAPGRPARDLSTWPALSWARCCVCDRSQCRPGSRACPRSGTRWWSASSSSDRPEKAIIMKTIIIIIMRPTWLTEWGWSTRPSCTSTPPPASSGR